MADLEHQYLMGTFKRLPVTLVSGHGVRVVDDRGREYLDLVAGIAVNLLGHAHPAIAEAVADQSRTLVHTSNLYFTEPQVRLAQKLVELSFPSRAFFCNSGAEANECAIKIARKWGKLNRGGAHEVISVSGAFHGRTLATVAATGNHKYSDPFEPVPAGFVHVPFDDLQALREATSARTAAVLLEPVQGESGVHVPSPGYLEAVRSWCDDQNLLLILDEVQSGLGRTGRWFAFQHAGVIPDVMTLAKGLGGGVPIGACLAGPRADVLEPGDHGSTFGGNPLACTAALAVLRTIEEQGLVGHAAEMEGLLREELASLSGVAEVRGVGLMQAVQFAEPVAKAFQGRCLEEGLIVNAVDDHSIRLVPPLILGPQDIVEAGEKMRAA
ncbi:MAG TPA: acetylornithine transaminase, partial [Candidatus Dormibacteraeota bacterium]